MAVFLDVAPCSLMEEYRRFRDWRGVRSWIKSRTEPTEPFVPVEALSGRHGAWNQRQCSGNTVVRPDTEKASSLSSLLKGLLSF
jgi:hypothetical protein